MRIVMHVDMDAFFAAVEERYNPHLRGRPLVVGADPKGGRGRGVVATANYPARKYGIRSAMPISTAWRLADEARRRGEPETVFVEGQHRLYAEVSSRIMAILAAEADAFEEASIDEAYLEWKPEILNPKSESGVWQIAEERAKQLKAKVLEAEGLTCSIGIGPNKLVAKIASDFKKPDGLTLVRPEGVQVFLDPLPIRAIPGIGPKSEALLHANGIRTIRELRGVELARLIEWFVPMSSARKRSDDIEDPRFCNSGKAGNKIGSKWGEDLYEKARGISESAVSNDWEPKSVGEQETFETDTLQPAFILERLRELGTAVFRRLRRAGFRSFRSVVVTVRFADFTTLTRSHTGSKPLTTLRALHGEALRLLLPFLDRRGNPRAKKIRLIGVRAEKLGRARIQEQA